MTALAETEVRLRNTGEHQQRNLLEAGATIGDLPQFDAVGAETQPARFLSFKHSPPDS
jgi:hypothetical protein